jgi:hypothetical protein
MIKSTWWGAFAIVLALAGCGGGGGDAGSSPFVTPPPPGSAVVGDLSLVLSETQIEGAGSDSVTATVTVVDANRVAMADVPVTIGADAGAVVVANAATTDSNGRVTATIGTGTDKSNRTITVTATAGTLTRTGSFAVIGAEVTLISGATLVAPGSTSTLTFRVSDSAASVIRNAPITVTAPGLTDVTGTTDNNGEFVYTYVAPSTTGTLTVTASASGATLSRDITVQTGTVPNATPGSVSSASISVDPSVVAAGGGRATLRALFVGAANAPVPNIRVRFDLGGDPNSIGGSITTGTAFAYSDADGTASSAYVSGTRSSPTDGVVIRACWDYADFAVGVCPNSVIKTLTVTSDALSVTLGFDNRLSDGPSGLTYIKRFVVAVNDAAGQAKPDVLITPSVDLLRYYKGWYVTPNAWVKARDIRCLNEDKNRNGVLEAGEDDTADLNGNGNGQLDPRKADVLVTVVGTTNTTDANGTAVLQIEYPKNVATWVDFRLLVTAGAVTGTEGRASVTMNLPGAAAEFRAQDAPSFIISPYGTAAVCTDPD